MDHAKAFGRIAFSCPRAEVSSLSFARNVSLNINMSELNIQSESSLGLIMGIMLFSLWSFWYMYLNPMMLIPGS